MKYKIIALGLPPLWEGNNLDEAKNAYAEILEIWDANPSAISLQADGVPIQEQPGFITSTDRICLDRIKKWRADLGSATTWEVWQGGAPAKLLFHGTEQEAREVFESHKHKYGITLIHLGFYIETTCQFLVV